MQFNHDKIKNLTRETMFSMFQIKIAIHFNEHIKSFERIIACILFSLNFFAQLKLNNFLQKLMKCVIENYTIILKHKNFFFEKKLTTWVEMNESKISVCSL